MAPTADFYKRMKITGLLCMVPFVLGAGPCGGYYLGCYLVARFALPQWVTTLCVVLGIAASVQETIRIFRAAIKA